MVYSFFVHCDWDLKSGICGRVDTRVVPLLRREGTRNVKQLPNGFASKVIFVKKVKIKQNDEYLRENCPFCRFNVYVST